MSLRITHLGSAKGNATLLETEHACAGRSGIQRASLERRLCRLICIQRPGRDFGDAPSWRPRWGCAIAQRRWGHAAANARTAEELSSPKNSGAPLSPLKPFSSVPIWPCCRSWCRTAAQTTWPSSPATKDNAPRSSPTSAHGRTNWCGSGMSTRWKQTTTNVCSNKGPIRVP